MKMEKKIKRKIAVLIKKVLSHFIINDYKGHFFIAGGLFKIILNSRLVPNDVDIFFPSEYEENKFKTYILNNGTFIIDNGYSINVQLDEYIFECINFKETKAKTLIELLKKFDIGISGIGIEYVNKKINVEILPEALQSIQKKTINIIQDNIKNHNILTTIERCNKYQADTGLIFDTELRNILIEIFYSHDELTQKKMFILFKIKSKEPKIIIEYLKNYKKEYNVKIYHF